MRSACSRCSAAGRSSADSRHSCTSTPTMRVPSGCTAGSALPTANCCRCGCCTKKASPDMAIRIDTGRLLLTELSDDDAEFILGLVNEPSFLHYIGDRGVRTLDDARRYIRQGPAASYQQYGYGLLRMGLKPEGMPIGMCGILRRDTLPEPDLGFSMLPAFWSKGYAHEAAAAVMTHARASA